MKRFDIINLSMVIILITQSTAFGIKSDDENTSLLHGNETSYETAYDIPDLAELVRNGSQQDIDNYLDDTKLIVQTPMRKLIEAQTIATKKRNKDLATRLHNLIIGKTMIYYYEQGGK